MSNSRLISYSKMTPCCYKPRAYKIEKITIHHMAGNSTVEECGALFAIPSRQVSSNYGIGSDGRIALYVDECNGPWTSSNYDNDNRAVTIEVANCSGAPDWKVSDEAYKSLIALCVDICRRNGIKKLNYTGDKSGNLTMHKWFAATACPGPYLEKKFPEIAKLVNAELAKDGERYQVTVNSLPIRKSASKSSAIVGRVKKGIYTITEKKTSSGYTWGRLKSGAGWICLNINKDYCKKV